MKYPKNYDVIVVGAGHAGCEAAWALARMQKSVLLLTLTVDNIAQLSCNPSIGGIAKGQLAKEVDALGGLMARVADASAIQYRTLNASKGPAVQSSRVQCDTNIYKQEMIARLMECERIDIVQGEAEGILLKDNLFTGIVVGGGVQYEAKSLIICAGTFLRGLCHIGDYQFESGRAGDPASVVFAKDLDSMGIRLMRLKTGTPARIDAKSLRWECFDVQESDKHIRRFSFYENGSLLPQIPCHIAHTNEKTHEIIRAATHRSPMYNGSIEGIGARYCPSIEDKVVRFADKDRHQIFLEPMGLRTSEIYPAGISSSLPFDVQMDFMRSIEGFENVHVIRPAYAIEYDALVSGQLKHNLSLREFPNIFMAGQINATSGYEEAAAQGLMAGVNAALYLDGEAPFVLRRDEAYIGVMIDDLVLRGFDEPYRMFTSRAEFRLVLREDNADVRLTPQGRRLGLITDKDWETFESKQEQTEKLVHTLGLLRVSDVNKAWLSDEEKARIPESGRLLKVLRRPEVDMPLLKKGVEALQAFPHDVCRNVEIAEKFEGYIVRENQRILAFQKQASRTIPVDFNYEEVNGLSRELIDKLHTYKPENFAQAERIQGITPAAINAIWIALNRPRKET